MGSKLSHNESCYVPDKSTLKRTPKNLPQQPKEQSEEKPTPKKQFQQGSLDPRSPNASRTPIQLQHYTERVSYVAEQREIHERLDVPIKHIHNNPLKRLLKSFAYNLRDPRSPKLNRTPLIFDEQKDGTLNLNDTFADFSVETHSATAAWQIDNIKNEAAATTAATVNFLIDNVMHTETDAEECLLAEEDCRVSLTESMIAMIDLSAESVNIILDDVVDDKAKQLDAAEAINVTKVSVAGETSASEFTQIATTNQQTPVALQQQIDPRSPTLGLERTPIIFADDDEASNDAMLESILGTLSQKLDGNSSYVSFDSPIGEVPVANADVKINTAITAAKPPNKRLKQLRMANRHSSIPERKTLAIQSKHIYEDGENWNLANKMAVQTPPSKNKSPSADSDTKRTPLSCIKNRSNNRGHSLNKMPIDTDTEENRKLNNLRMMQCCLDDSLQT